MPDHKIPTIYIATPSYDGSLQKETAIAALVHNTKAYQFLFFSKGGSSLLARGFNWEWAQALSEYDMGNCTHFAMIHGDIIPEHLWLKIMLDEMDKYECDILSAVVPIKGFNANGTVDSSTAIGQVGNIWHADRIPLSFIQTLPETFCITDITQEPERELLVNTGLLLVKLDEKCAETTEHGTLKLFFTISDRIRKEADKYVVDVASEDWNFSRMANKMGKKVMATRRVRLIHRGLFDYTNAVEMHG